MNYRRTVNLVSTLDAIKMHFPELYREPAPGCKQGILSADFPIEPSACATVLGSWLAAHISTTRFDDDGSWCSILTPATEMGLTIRELGEKLLRHQEADITATELMLAMMEQWIERQRKIITGYGNAPFRHRVIQFDWPVFGSLRVVDAKTPEAYFDVCARHIRIAGGAILNAGLSRESPPDSLVDNMAQSSGGGLALLRRYRESGLARLPQRS
jgi:hypothetical protein